MFIDKKEYIVPNIVHYNWYNKERKQMKFSQMLAVLSAFRHIKPDAIYFHTNKPPDGEYWELLNNLTSLTVVNRTAPTQVRGVKMKKSKFDTSNSDIDRVLLILEYGGIYLDLDIMVLKPFDDLRRYQCTVGLEGGTKVCGGIIIGEKDSTFLTLWLNYFLEDYRADQWAYNSGKVPSMLALRYPHLVHIEKESLHRPAYFEREKIWGAVKYNWKNNYAIHTWIRLYDGPQPTPENIKRMNSTYGEIARLVYYGSTAML